MSYWISLVSGDRDHREIWDGVHCSWNYSQMMQHLPCGWARNWQGKQAQDMLKPILKSINLLDSYPEDYEQYEVDPEKGLGTIHWCIYILRECFNAFRQYPKGIIVIDQVGDMKYPIIITTFLILNICCLVIYPSLLTGICGMITAACTSYSWTSYYYIKRQKGL